MNMKPLIVGGVGVAVVVGAVVYGCYRLFGRKDDVEIVKDEIGACAGKCAAHISETVATLREYHAKTKAERAAKTTDTTEEATDQFEAAAEV